MERSKWIEKYNELNRKANYVTDYIKKGNNSNFYHNSTHSYKREHINLLP